MKCKDPCLVTAVELGRKGKLIIERNSTLFNYETRHFGRLNQFKLNHNYPRGKTNFPLCLSCGAIQVAFNGIHLSPIFLLWKISNNHEFDSNENRTKFYETI